jgi:plastocyanin
MRRWLTLAVALVVAAAVAVPALAATPTKAHAKKAAALVATDGPGFTITLTSGGKKVTTLKAGAYSVTVKDLSNIHNFHLTGPGVNKTTSVAAKGTFKWAVTLKKGTYKYVCDPHKTIMKGSFKVT